MDPHQQQQQQQQQPPPSTPIRGVATAAANAALLAATASTPSKKTATTTTSTSSSSSSATKMAMMPAVDVIRTVSAESHDSHALSCGSVPTTATGSVGGGSGAGGGNNAGAATTTTTTTTTPGAGSGSLGGGSLGGGGGDCGSTIASQRSGSFRTSPLSTTPRLVSMGAGSIAAIPPIPMNPAASNTGGSGGTAPATTVGGGPVVAPPPWPVQQQSQQPPQQQQQSPPQPPSPTHSSSPQQVVPRSSNSAASQETPSNIHFPKNPSPNTPPPPPPMVVSDNNNGPFPSLSLSMTSSGDALNSTAMNGTSSSVIPANNNTSNNTSNRTGNVKTAAVDATTDSSVLLGLEELERQQADVERRREEAKIQLQQKQQQQQQQQSQQSQQQSQQQALGLPPLPPSIYRPSSAPTYPESTSKHHDAVPSQIHLLDGDEDTILSSDVPGGAAGGGAKGDLKRVTSIEKLRGSVSVSLRRFRSWSQDALARSSLDPAAAGATNSSVDSTQNTLSRGSNEGGRRQSMETISGGVVGTTPKLSNKKATPTATRTDVISEPYLDDDELKPLIYGFLHKLGRNGHWQRRFFETNGERLTYYKSVKRTKVLATLDLCKVGEISIDKTDPEECTFTIAVKNRPYFLRAEDKARCNDWVIILNRAREARMNVGNIQLVTPKLEGGNGGVGLSSHRSQAGSDDYAPCIVISALRPRTQAVMNFEGDDALGLAGVPDLLTSNSAEEEQIEVMKWDDDHQKAQGTVGVVGGGGGGASSPLPGGGESQAMAKWQKRHSKMHILSLRFLRWARSITHQTDACRRECDVVVVPAHVVVAAQRMAMNAGQSGSGRATSPSATSSDLAAGGKQPPQQQPHGIKHKMNRPSDGVMPNLMEETPPPTPSTADENPDSLADTNRSRASTESPAFGSTYV